MSAPVFTPFPKIPRLKRNCTITEKLDGTNAQVHITEDGVVYAGSRNRFISQGDDNFGFAAWVCAHKDELLKLGPGTHFGEWWGLGIQRGYGLAERRFSLFDVNRWDSSTALYGSEELAPECCSVVPVLYEGPYSTDVVDDTLARLWEHGSKAAPGYFNPEGVCVYHHAGRQYYKVLLENDAQSKGIS